tara:strand:- start:1483 stop:2268 length:786 start_codon:yes stop_codon:yes gene_type:complete
MIFKRLPWFCVLFAFWLIYPASENCAQDLVVVEANGIASTVTSLIQRSKLTVDGKVIGNVVTDEVEQGEQTQKVKLLKVESLASRIVVSADNEKRVPVPVIKMSDGFYIVNGTGRVWVTVQCVDFEKQIFDQKQLVLELPKGQKDEPTVEPPIAEDGLRVMIVVESSQISQMDPKQREILFNLKTRTYLNRRCIKGEDGQPSWRIMDPDTEFPDGCDSIWCQALARDRETVPWLVVSNGKTGVEMPLPKTMNDFLEVVEKF